MLHFTVVDVYLFIYCENHISSQLLMSSEKKTQFLLYEKCILQLFEEGF